MSLHRLLAISPAWETFLIAHREWEKCNNPQGWKSGQVHIFWEKRTRALLELVRAEEPFRKLARIVAARGS
jgi:hypothetical protein